MSTAMEFEVVYILTIYDEHRSRFTFGNRKSKLPFVPLPGLEMLIGGIGFGVINSTSWDEESCLFRCYFEYEVDPLEIDDDIEFQIKMAKRCGFEGFEEVYETPKNS